MVYCLFIEFVHEWSDPTVCSLLLWWCQQQNYWSKFSFHSRETNLLTNDRITTSFICSCANSPWTL